jgi:hypothetical protein
MPNARVSDYVPQDPSPDQLSFSQAIEILRDGVSSSYADRVAPIANLHRVAHDMTQKDRSHKPLNDRGNFLFPLFRYQKHTPEQIQDGIARSIEEATPDPNSRLLTQIEIKAIIKEAAYRKQNGEYPYN